MLITFINITSKFLSNLVFLCRLEIGNKQLIRSTFSTKSQILLDHLFTNKDQMTVRGFRMEILSLYYHNSNIKEEIICPALWSQR